MERKEEKGGEEVEATYLLLNLCDYRDKDTTLCWYLSKLKRISLRNTSETSPQPTPDFTFVFVVFIKRNTASCQIRQERNKCSNTVCSCEGQRSSGFGTVSHV